jgi:hypothetical protein
MTSPGDADRALASDPPSQEPYPGLGPVRDTFRPNFANLAAGIILGSGLVIGGLLLGLYVAPGDALKPQKWTGWIELYGPMVLLGGLPMLGGFALLVWVKRLFSHQVVVCENGLVYVYRGVEESCPRDQLVEIREVFTEESLKILKVPGAAITNIDRTLLVWRKDGKSFSFDVNPIKGLSRLAEHLAEASVKHGIPWQRVEP